MPSGACNPTQGVPQGFIGMWSGGLGAIPTGWALCDGTSGTPDLRDKFIQGAGGSLNVGNTGGAASHSHPLTSIITDIVTNFSVPEGDAAPNSPVNVTGEMLGIGTTNTDSTDNVPPFYALAFIMKL